MKFIISDEAGWLKPLVKKVEIEGFTVEYTPKYTFRKSGGADVIVVQSSYPIHHPDHNLIGITESFHTLLSNLKYMYTVLKALDINVPLIHLADDGKIFDEVIDESKKYALESPSLPTLYIEAEGARTTLNVLNSHHLTLLVRELPYKMEVEIEGWFNGSRIMSPAFVIFGGILLHPLSRKTRLFQHTVEKLEDGMKRLDYKGPVSLVIGVDEKKVWGIKVKSNFKPVVFEAMKGIGNNLRNIVTGARNTLNTTEKWVIQIPLLLDPFVAAYNLGIPIRIKEESSLKHLWLLDMDKEIYRGKNSVVGYITARGETVRECIRRVGRTRKNIFFPYMIEGHLESPVKMEEGWKKLKRWGWV